MTTRPTATLPVKKMVSHFCSSSAAFSCRPPSTTATYWAGKTADSSRARAAETAGA